MRHRVKRTKLNRDRDGRKAIERGLLKQIIEHGHVETTLMKAKYIRPRVEKLVTKAKKNDLATRRLLIQRLNDKVLAKKLLEEIAPKYQEVEGGYLRIRRTTIRKGDSAQLAEVSFVEVTQPKIKETKNDSKNSTKTKKAKTKLVEKNEGEKKGTAKPNGKSESKKETK